MELLPRWYLVGPRYGGRSNLITLCGLCATERPAPRPYGNLTSFHSLTALLERSRVVAHLFTALHLNESDRTELCAVPVSPGPAL